MSITCVPHAYAVIRLEEDNEVKVVKKKQLRLQNFFAAGSLCRLIVQTGMPKNGKIVKTFTTANEAKMFVNNMNTIKMVRLKAFLLYLGCFNVINGVYCYRVGGFLPSLTPNQLHLLKFSQHLLVQTFVNPWGLFNRF